MPIPQVVRQELHKRWKGPPSPYRESQSLVLGELTNYILAVQYVHPEQVATRLSGRIKEIPRITEKVDRYGRHSVNSIEVLEELITDIVGVRVTVDYLHQVKQIKDFVVNHKRWTVIKVDDSLRDNGYRAVHIDLKTATTHFEEVRCEIQIRTLLQDAWAIWSHPLYERYRRNLTRIPKQERALLRHISDMLHVADEMVQTLIAS